MAKLYVDGKGVDMEQARMLIAEQLQRNDLREDQRAFWERSARSAGMPIYPGEYSHPHQPHAKPGMVQVEPEGGCAAVLIWVAVLALLIAGAALFNNDVLQIVFAVTAVTWAVIPNLKGGM